MKMKSVFVTSILTAFLLVGCNSAQIKNNANIAPGSYQTNQAQNLSDAHQAINLQIESIRGVGDASVVHYGDSIFIGLKKDPRYQGSDYSLKQKVKESLQGLAKNNILYVVTDRDLYNRIDKISQRIQNNELVSNKELNTLMNQVGLKVKPFSLIEKS